MSKRFAIVIGVTAAGAMAFAAPASATTDTFNYTGAAQTWTVPTGVSSATFDLYGAQGAGAGGVASPGLGGRATATIPVTPGASIQVNVGGQGSQFGAGGFNGGGAGGNVGANGGGGASDIRIAGTALADRKLVAGGGGGAGTFSCANEPVSGGDGGGESGEAGLASTAGICAGTVAGGGGKQDATGGTATAPATKGEFGVGGVGGFATGGGGGGGWFGGGGGAGAGGGGGSGYCPAPCTNFETGVRGGNGLVTITYSAPTIASLIDSVEALDLPHGIENSLLKKLTGAQRSLDAGHTHGTCGKLAAFIHQVKAQSGKKIDADDAASLIDEANAVRDSVGCT